MRKFIKPIVLLFLVATNIASYASVIDTRTIAVLDLTTANSEASEAELFSIKHILKVAGLPFIVTNNVDTAIQYGMVIASSKLESGTLNTAAKNSLISYVSNGGTLIAPNVKDNYLFPLFGISAGSISDLHFEISFNMPLNDPAFRWLNDIMEQTISLGDAELYSTFLTTRSYSVSDAVAVAEYNDHTAAITKNNYGNGKTYALGFSFKNLILLYQTNHDESAQRVYSNGFEPSGDAVILFIKAICTETISNSVWLHTSPFNSKSTLMITHDVDARTSVDTMHYYADYENSIGVSATYLITTHYLDDGCMTDYFNPGNYSKVQYLLDKGHKLASHSVGHFGDFDNESVAPLGMLGNTQANYLPYDSCTSSPTSGSTVIGETEVSKNLLESLFGVPIRTFRAGYLCFNDKLINALDTLGYRYNTTLSAADVLTNFPFLSHKDRISSGALSNVWEIPMTISDVFQDNLMSLANYHEKEAIWLDVILRNKANYAPNVLLIHPTRVFKLWAEQDLLNQLPDDIMVCDLETYGDFWKSRDNITFTTTLENNVLTVIVPHTLLPLDSSISFIVDNGQDLTAILAKDDLGNPVEIIQSGWDDNGIILHFGYFPPILTSVDDKPGIDETSVSCYPNPFNEETTIEIWLKEKSITSVSIYNLTGQVIKSFGTETLQSGVYHYNWDAAELPSGIYLCEVNVGDKTIVKKIVLSR